MNAFPTIIRWVEYIIIINASCEQEMLRIPK